MNRTLIVGDVHLGKGLNMGKPGVGFNYNSRIVDQINLLNWILDIAVNKNVERIILTGDVFEDVKPEYYIFEIFVDWIDKLKLENIELHIVAGNHDVKRMGSIYVSVLDIINSLGFDNVHVYKNMYTIETEGAGFTFVPFRDRRGMGTESKNDAINLIKDLLDYESISIQSGNCKVLIGHLALEGSIFVGDECDDSINELLCPLDMFDSYDYVWMGHVHKPQVRKEKPYIAHIGSLDLSDYGETDHKKHIILFDTEADEKFEIIYVPSRPLKRIRIDVDNKELDSTGYVIDFIAGQKDIDTFKNALVKIEITLRGADVPNVDRKKVEEYLYDLGAFYISSFSESRNISVISNDKKDIVENTIKPKSAIKVYASLLEFDDEHEKTEFIDICNDIIDESA